MRTIGVDTGGTFTDLVLRDGDEVRVEKLPSTPDDPARAVVEGLKRLGPVDGGDHVIHGTTVALNALLTRQTARAALVTGMGFRDLIEIGRQDRPDIYALHPRKAEPLIPRELRFEVTQRSWPAPDGTGLVEVRAPEPAELAALADELRGAEVESVAVCLLHAWADPSIESRVAEALVSLGVPITLSGTLLPEYREHERFSTAAVNAALVPRMRAYLAGLEEKLGGARLSLLQSSGGTLPAHRAALEPVRVLLSGPAGGVVGAARAAAEAGLGRIATLDMGGTSSDVAFVDSERGARRAGGTADPALVGGLPVAVPTLDVHTIGCGGGSLVTIDAGGVLHVGPKSAGADPGPVCYGKSDALTVTDAHALLGHLGATSFVGGSLELDFDAVRRAFEALGQRFGRSAEETALGVLEVARAAMRRAIGVMTMQRGYDPSKLALAAFGGAGGLHGAYLAASLGMKQALIPHLPGALSAVGMAGAGAQRDLAQTVLEPLLKWSAANRAEALGRMDREATLDLLASGHGEADLTRGHTLDLRYAGQSFELEIPDGPDPEADFHAAHEDLYGYRLDRGVELVCLRSRVSARSAAPLPPAPTDLGAPERSGDRQVDLGRGPVETAIFEREGLEPGHAFEGPAIVEEYSGTTLVPGGWTARVTGGRHLLLEH